MKHPFKDMPIYSAREFTWEESKAMPVEENGEDLVPASLVPEKILVRPLYYINGIEGAIPECYVRRTVLSRLLKAAELLPQGFRLVLFDAWRPKALQTSLFQKFRSELRERMPLLDDQEITALASQFVALPSAQSVSPSPHITGGAVDLTIVDDSGICLEMGTEFDTTTEKSATVYYEKKAEAKEKMSAEDQEAMYNRRLLFGVMTKAGFTNYPDEWWHYDYGNQNWALLKGEKEAFYGVSEPFFRWK
jgi:D-alanyl-D-alanine dipeptidase